MAFLDDVLVGIKTVTDATGGSDVPVNAASRHLRISGDGVAVSGSSNAIDLIIQGADAPRAKVVATSNLTLAGAQTIDGQSCIAGDVVLATGQTTASENRLWTVQSGAWTPAPDMTTSAQIKAGMLISVRLGTANANTIWQLSSGGPFTIGVTSLSWNKAGGKPAVPVSNTTAGILPQLVDRGQAIPSRSGPLVSVYDTITYDKLQLHAKSYLDYASGSYGLAILTARDDLLARTGGKNGGKIQLPHDVLTIDRQLDFEGWTGLEIHGIGGSGYFSKCQLIFSAAPAANITGASSTSNTIGTGSKTFTIGTGLYVRQNDWIRFTASGGYVEGQVTAYNTGTGSCTINSTITSGSGTFASWMYSANTKDFLISFRGTLGCAVENVRLNVPQAMTTRHNVIDCGHGLAAGDGYNFKLSRSCIFGTDYNDLHTALNLGGATGANITQNMIAWAGYGIAASNGPFTFDDNTILDCQYYPYRVGSFCATISNTTVEPLSAGPNAGRARFAEVIRGTTNITFLANYCGDSTSPTTEWIHSEGEALLNLQGNYFSGNPGASAVKTEGDWGLVAVGNRLDLGIALLKSTNSVQPQSGIYCLGNKYASGSAGPFADPTTSATTGTKAIWDPGFVYINTATIDQPQLIRPTLQFGILRAPANLAVTNGTNHHVANPDILTRFTGPTGPYEIHDCYIGGIITTNELEAWSSVNQYCILKNASGAAAGVDYQLLTQTGADVVIDKLPYARWKYTYLGTGAGWSVTPLSPTVVPGTQKFTATLTAGVSAAITAVLTSSSVIVAACKTPGGTTTNTAEYIALTADRTTGVPGSFKISAVGTDRTTVNTLDTSTVEIMVIS